MVMLAADQISSQPAEPLPSSSSSSSSSAAPPSVSATGTAPGAGKDGLACGTGGSPTLRIPSPSATALLSADLFSNMDDEVRSVGLPFAMMLYGTSASTVYISTNGILSFEPTIAWDASLLPSTNLPSIAAAPYWTDLSIPFQEFTWGIWYSLDTSANALVVEWILGKAGNLDEIYQFQLEYRSAAPGVLVYRYFVVGGNGKGAGVGVQGGKFLVCSPFLRGVLLC
ncbi:hypothetical protein B0J12DRAFT_265966 [Macrophomina phaseolina]|uniref:Uncharacterized protein n=1 Tax=Macrophomina phaseolina TaxID=35725 RepID=A0ABQ8FYR1_9PEZI|nr:hypothetical protein B0J12DRAFT_265966 [Macrophomina phaseolina]